MAASNSSVQIVKDARSRSTFCLVISSIAMLLAVFGIIVSISAGHESSDDFWHQASDERQKLIESQSGTISDYSTIVGDQSKTINDLRSKMENATGTATFIPDLPKLTKALTNDTTGFFQTSMVGHATIFNLCDSANKLQLTIAGTPAPGAAYIGTWPPGPGESFSLDLAGLTATCVGSVVTFSNPMLATTGTLISPHRGVPIESGSGTVHSCVSGDDCPAAMPGPYFLHQNSASPKICTIYDLNGNCVNLNDR